MPQLIALSGTVEEVAALAAKLGLVPATVVSATQAPSTLAPAVTATAPAKATKPAKAPAPPAEAPAPSAPPAEPPAQAPATPPAVEGIGDPVKFYADKLRPAMLALGAADRPAAERVLKTLGVESLKTLDASRYAEALALVQAEAAAKDVA